MEFFEMIMILLCFILFCYFYSNKDGTPTNWPIIGMLPSLLKNVHRINDHFAELANITNMTSSFAGPWFTNMDMLTTSDPANVHYVMSKNFGNYPKGSKFKEIFDVFGDGIFNADDQMWQCHRTMAHSFFRHAKFHHLLVETIGKKVESGVIPILDEACKQGIEVDLQDLFERFTFDNICRIVMGHDPMSLSVDLPDVPSSTALDDIERSIYYRHALPPFLWKFLRWLDLGHEKKYRKAWQTLDDFIYKYIAKKRDYLSNEASQAIKNDELDDLLTLYLKGSVKDETYNIQSDKFLRDTILNFFIAGRDTTSTALTWFFYVLSKNPQVVGKIREELNNMMVVVQKGENEAYNITRNSKELNNKLVYLHAALCEALRLYPPVVFQSKTPVEEDVLPSGHQVTPNMQVIFNMYSMGRMKWIWGEDCCEFKPERWISERGKIKYEPSYKFFVFNAGPRACVGKDMAFTQMKAVAAIIIHNYHIHAVEGHPLIPDTSIILRMKHGFKVKVSKLT